MPETILIVDDKTIFRELLAALFEKNGFTTATAASGAEALGRLREQSIHLILLDLELHGMTGLEFLERLRQSDGVDFLPAIILTDLRQKNSVIRAAALGVRDYMLKSNFSTARLLTRVRELLASASAGNILTVASTLALPTPSPAPVTQPEAPAAAQSPAATRVTQSRAAAVTPAAKTPRVSAESAKSIPHQPKPAKAPIRTGPPPNAQPAVSPAQGTWPKLLPREKTLERLDEVAGGNTLAGVVSQVISVASNPDADLADVVRVIQSDPVLASRVLQLANSVSTGARGRVSNVADAARNIGVRGIQNMAISIGIVGAFPPDEADGFNTMRCWQHSYAVAELVNLILHDRDPQQEGINHLVGLCHDLGEILLRQHFMSEYDKIVQFAVEHRLSIHEVETVALGIRHPELISRLLSRIGLPIPVVNAIREFYERQIKEQSAGMSVQAQVLGMANLVAHGLLLAASPHEMVRPISRVEWRHLDSQKPPPSFDPAIKRDEILTATNVLARLPAHEEKRLLMPLIPRQSKRIWYTRPELFIELDPVAYALQLICDVKIAPAPPAGDQWNEIDGLVVVGLRAGIAPVIPADLARASAAAGRPDVPILALVSQAPAANTEEPSIRLQSFPISLADLQDWLSAIPEASMVAEEMAV